MNLQEFSALKTGDEVESMDGSRGKVIETFDKKGVTVVWGGAVASPFFYSVAGTFWFHWTPVRTLDNPPPK